MTSLLLSPTDVLEFRDGPSALPGSGCAWPFPNAIHDALRTGLLELAGSRQDFASLQTRGPLPWHPQHGHLFPIPLDASRVPEGIRRHRLLPIPPGERNAAAEGFTPPCLPAPDVSSSQAAVLTGWWTAAQMHQYLGGANRFDAAPVASGELWVDESVPSAEASQLRLKSGVRIAIQAGFDAPANGEMDVLDALLRSGLMRLGEGEHLVQFERKKAAWPSFETPAPVSWDGPFHVRWVLLSPAIFEHGSLPGWCRARSEKHALPDGQVGLRENKNRSFIRAHLIAHHLGAPIPLTRLQAPEDSPAAVRLAVPAGSVYHFLCADSTNAVRLVSVLHGRHRSDEFREMGFGFGLCAKPELISTDLTTFASQFFAA